MKQYTEAERADIATECRRAIFEAKSKNASYRTLARGAIAEIALASLEDEPAVHGGWIKCTERLPESEPYTWSKPVAAISNLGDVFQLKCMGDYWQRSAAFVDSGAHEITHWMPLPDYGTLSAPPAQVVLDDYFSFLVSSARVRAEKAMKKFPQPNYVLNKVAEEHGEVVKAVIHYTEGRETWCNVEGELIDNLAMLIRLVREGDGKIGFTPPAEVLRLNDNSAPATDNTEEQYHSISREKGGVK